MTDQSTLGIYDLTKPVTLSYRSLDKARAFKKGGKDRGEPKFDGTFLFETGHPDWDALRKVAAAVARAKWPNRDLKEIAFPFKSGDARFAKAEAEAKKAGKDVSPVAAAEKGKGVLTARSKYRPGLGGVENGVAVDYNTDEAVAKAISKFYSGAQVYASFKFVTYEAVRDGDKDGVNVYLNSVFTLNKGEKLGGGGTSTAERFSAYVGAATEFDPTGGEDIPGADDDLPPLE